MSSGARNQMVEKLPQVLQKKLNFKDATKPPIGYSPETMWLLPYGYEGKPCVFKYSNRIEVYKEGQVYTWLKGKMPVPAVYFNEKIGDTYYLVVEKLAGEMLSQTFQNWTKQETITFYANLLKQIHQLDPSNFPFRNNLEDRLERIVVSEAKTQYFERELQGKDPQVMYDFLIENQDFTKDEVVCHGDVCFPNFMMKDNQLVGLIDVSGAGVEDRYLDIAIALRTLRFNFEMMSESLTQQDINDFCFIYGIKSLDEFKLKYYIYLDELTNG